MKINTWSILNLQDRASYSIQQLSEFHDFTIIIITLITTLVGLNILFIYTNKFTNKYLLEEQNTEIIWTVCPIFILIIIAIPSLSTLYILDDSFKPSLTVKAVGHQWYWSYEYSDFPNLEFDSYIIPQTENKLFHHRLLEVDNRLILPVNTQIRVITTGADVIHSWTVPALGIKADAIPGRINQIFFTIDRVGIFYGQCSEICGANHRFIPIKIESIPINNFLKWLKG